MKYRIVTHGNCTDGYCSAFVVKKFFNTLFGTKLTEQEIQEIPVLGVQPQDIQAGKVPFSSADVVVDLPKPDSKIFFWCDHHLTTKPTAALPENQYWKAAPSCTGFLIAIALEKGAKSSTELVKFKKAIDINDSAAYTKKDIKDCYYKRKSYQQQNSLQKLTMIGAMFNTRDRVLNDEIFRTLLSSELGETPLSSKSLWQLNPIMFYKAQLESFELWRKNVDIYLRYDAEAQCVVQDDRKANINIGVPDRFYSYLKFPQASYHMNLRIIDEVLRNHKTISGTPEGGSPSVQKGASSLAPKALPSIEKKARLGIGSNIFHKERCKVDISKLCQEVGKKFGGSGGGHFAVGGAVIKADKADEAIKFILEILRGKMQ